MAIFQQITRACKECGKEFTTYVNSRKILCDNCVRKNRIIRNQKLDKNYICEECGKSFNIDFRKEGRLLGPPRFCSRSCSNTFTSLKADNTSFKEVPCIKCGKIIKIKLKASKNTAVCDECKEKEISKKKDRFKLSCQFCGREIDSRQLRVHEKSCFLNPSSIHYTHERKRSECREGYIYLITNIINDKKYIGKCVGNPENSKGYLGSGIAIQSAIKKYGKENFKKEILQYVEDGDLNLLEEFYIEKYKTKEFGYNLTSGGDGGDTNTGKHWYTNGKINTLKFECPEGFWKKYN